VLGPCSYAGFRTNNLEGRCSPRFGCNWNRSRRQRLFGYHWKRWHPHPVHNLPGLFLPAWHVDGYSSLRHRHKRIWSRLVGETSYVRPPRHSVGGRCKRNTAESDRTVPIALFCYPWIAGVALSLRGFSLAMIIAIPLIGVIREPFV